ncbi:hypothetical protein EDD16DRAFT_261624 [Pisolithus croceorrhizus]|nr:hypothetical protein EDD16DRAFT_261624 [Pisolithus croceorrhizus]
MCHSQQKGQVVTQSWCNPRSPVELVVGSRALIHLLVQYLHHTLAVDLSPALTLALVTLMTRICTHIRVGPAAVIPTIPATTGTAAHHHLRHDLHTHAYWSSRGMNPHWSGHLTCFRPPVSPVYARLVVVTCQPTREGCAAAVAHLSLRTGCTE